MKKTFEEFIKEFYPDKAQQYQLYLLSDEELIGKHCISIQSGFSGPPGTKCYISRIQKPYKETQLSPEWDRINFLGREGFESRSELGWQILRKDLFYKVKLDL